MRRRLRKNHRPVLVRRNITVDAFTAGTWKKRKMEFETLLGSLSLPPHSNSRRLVLIGERTTRLSDVEKMRLGEGDTE